MIRSTYFALTFNYIQFTTGIYVKCVENLHVDHLSLYFLPFDFIFKLSTFLRCTFTFFPVRPQLRSYLILFTKYSWAVSNMRQGNAPFKFWREEKNEWNRIKMFFVPEHRDCISTVKGKETEKNSFAILSNDVFIQLDVSIHRCWFALLTTNNSFPIEREKTTSHWLMSGWSWTTSTDRQVDFNNGYILNPFSRILNNY